MEAVLEGKIPGAVYYAIGKIEKRASSELC